MRNNNYFLITFLLSLILTMDCMASDRPNVLWIISEDNSCYLGCYGDKNAHTPNLDALAAKGIRYTNCFANAPVCAPARSTLFLGMHASAAGTFHMRSKYKVPTEFTPYFTSLKKAGYLTANAKSDINTATHNIGKIVDGKAISEFYLNREDKNQPFVAVHNIMTSHESQIFVSSPDQERNPKKLLHPLDIPDYQIDNAETRMDWARVYNRIDKLDKQIGSILKKLENSGEAENTIIFYCSDHAGIMIRSKRYLYDSGTRVPFIAYFPEKWKDLAPAEYTPGKVSNRLIDFTDIPKTLLHLTGADIPTHFTGNTFAGKKQDKPKDYILLFSGRFDECPDNSRALTDGRYKYIRNYEPDRKLNQLEEYPLKQISQRSQYQAHQKGQTNAVQSAHYHNQPAEAFFDTANDKHEVHNLIDSPEYADLIQTFRKALDQQLIQYHDVGFIPEPLMAKIDKNTTVYQWAQSEENYPLEEILKLANLAGTKDPAYLPEFITKLNSPNPVIRYWAAVGLRIMGKEAKPAQSALESALLDKEASVRIVASCALSNLGVPPTPILLKEAQLATNDAHANWVIDAFKYCEITNLPSDHEASDFKKGKYSSQAYKTFIKGKTYSKLPE